MKKANNMAMLSAGFLIWLCATSASAGDATAGKTKAMLCAGCHGAEGISMSPDIPNLAGQKEIYLIKSATAYKTGARKNPMMQSIIANVSKTDIADIAAYYSSLK